MMVKKLMSLGLVGVLSVSLMVGCDSNNEDDDTITIKHVDENGNTIKKEKVTKKEAKRIEESQKQQTTKDNKIKDNSPTKKETKKQQPKEDSTTEDNRNLDDILYGNAARGTCPDCGRTAMVFNHGNGLKCAYCGFYDDGYFLPEEPDPIDSDNKDDEYVPDDNDYDDYDETQDYEESPSEPVEEDMN